MRRLGRLCFRAGSLVGVIAGSRPGPLPAQSLLRLGAGGEVGGHFESQRFSYGRGASAGGTDYRLWFSLPVTGSLFGARLLNYQANLQPTFLWQRRTGFQGPQRYRQLNLAAAATLLGGSPLTLSVNGSKVSSASSGGLGGVRDYGASVRGADLSVRFNPLPIRLSFTRSSLDETWRNPGSVTPLRNVTLERSYRLSAANSKLSLQAQRYDHDDLVRDLDYSSRAFQAVHVLRWGHGSRLESAYEAADQQGVFPYRRREWRERLELRHSSRVRTEYSYSRLRYGNDGGSVTTRSLGGLLTVVLNRAVTLGAVVSRHASARDSARDAVVYLAPRAMISLGRSSGVRVSGSVGIGGERRSVEGAASVVTISDEPHEVPASRLITLDNPDVEPGLLLVRNDNRNVTYLEGVDYEVLRQGRLLQLRILPTSRIGVGGVLLVSYRYRVPAEGRASALRADLTLSASYRGFALGHQQSLRRTRQIGSTSPAELGGAPSDFEDTRTVLSFRSNTRAGRLDLSASRRSRTRVEQGALDYELSSSYAPPRWGSFDGIATAMWSSTRSNGRRQDGLTLSGAVGWAVSRSLTLGGTLESTGLSQSDGPTLRYLTGRFNAGWQLDRILIDLSLDLYRHTAPSSRSSGRFSVRLTRQL